MKKNIFKSSWLYVILSIAIALCGCTTFKTPEIKSFTGTSVTDCDSLYQFGCQECIVDKNICTARNEVKNREKHYAKISRELRDQNSYFFDLPLIGMAAASAASLFYGSHTDVLGGLGIGAGTTAGLKTYAGNHPKAALYETAKKSLSQIYINSDLFMSASYALKELKADIEQAGEGMKKAEDIITGLDAGEEKTTLEKAVVSTKTAIKMGRDAQAAIKGCAVTIYETAELVQANLESGLGGILPDFDAIITGIEASAQTKSETAAASENLEEDAADTDKKVAILSYKNNKDMEVAQIEYNKAKQLVQATPNNLSGNAKIAFDRKVLELTNMEIALSAKQTAHDKKKAALELASTLNALTKKINDLAPDYITAASEIKKCAAKL